jgi:hypothetical protein
MLSYEVLGDSKINHTHPPPHMCVRLPLYRWQNTHFPNIKMTSQRILDFAHLFNFLSELGIVMIPSSWPCAEMGGTLVERRKEGKLGAYCISGLLGKEAGSESGHTVQTLLPPQDHF